MGRPVVTNEKECTYQIRVCQQDLCSEWFSNGLYSTPNKVISFSELKEDLKINGLEIIKTFVCAYSSSYYFTVKGKYRGSIKMYKI